MNYNAFVYTLFWMFFYVMVMVIQGVLMELLDLIDPFSFGTRF